MKRPIIVLECVLFLMLGTICPAAADDMVSQDLTMMKARLEKAVGGIWEIETNHKLRGRESKDATGWGDTGWACTIIPNPKMSHAGFEAAQEIERLSAIAQSVFGYNDFYLLIGSSKTPPSAFSKIEETLKMEALDPPKALHDFVAEQCDCSWAEEGFRLSKLKRNVVASPRLGIYLIEKYSKDMEKAELAPWPVLSEADIVSYDWEAHMVTLTSDGLKKLDALSRLIAHGKPFVIVADGQRCYMGGFWSPMSSIRPPYPLIYLSYMTGPHAVLIEKGSGADPRSDARILKTLIELNKLKVSGSDDVTIEFTRAGLTSVKVDQAKRLHFSWHTGRRPFVNGDSSPMRQDLTAYDGHNVSIWLTKEEVHAFAKWVEYYQILALKAEYPEPEVETRGSAFKSSLSVTLDGKKHSLSWTGDTKIPDTLREAIRELIELSDNIRKSRERTGADALIPNGRLGYLLGTYLTIEGVRVDKGKTGSRTLSVDTVNGRKLSNRPKIWIENAEFQDLPPGTRCVFKGYESGKMIGVPHWTLEPENSPGPQAPWQFQRYFIVTSVVEPESLEKE